MGDPASLSTNVSVAMPGIEGSRLQLEVSETIASANPELTCSVLAQLNRLEVGTVIDDFGTGRVRLMDLRAS